MLHAFKIVNESERVKVCVYVCVCVCVSKREREREREREIVNTSEASKLHTFTNLDASWYFSDSLLLSSLVSVSKGSLTMIEA